MTQTRTIMITVVAVAFVGFLSGAVRADWDPNSATNPTNHKMHYPQLPDPNGWDVRCTNPIALADDWKCSQTGPVNDIHLWGSWEGDRPGNIEQIGVAIFDNIAAGVGDIPYSRPGNMLWSRDFGPNQFTLRPYGDGDQGWYDPYEPVSLRPNHNTFHQINIVNIDDPFPQKEGEIYWLGVMVSLLPSDVTPQPIWGWKTSLSQFEDDAVWTFVEEDQDPSTLVFNELRDPDTNESLDLAFVITPEPATLGLVLIGGLAVLMRRRNAGQKILRLSTCIDKGEIS
jgi:hypothetical protein